MRADHCVMHTQSAFLGLLEKDQSCLDQLLLPCKSDCLAVSFPWHRFLHKAVTYQQQNVAVLETTHQVTVTDVSLGCQGY